MKLSGFFPVALVESHASEAAACTRDTGAALRFPEDPLGLQIPRPGFPVILLPVRYVADHNEPPGSTYRISQPAPYLYKLIKPRSGVFKVALVYGHKGHIRQRGACRIEIS